MIIAVTSFIFHRIPRPGSVYMCSAGECQCSSCGWGKGLPAKRNSLLKLSCTASPTQLHDPDGVVCGAAGPV